VPLFPVHIPITTSEAACKAVIDPTLTPDPGDAAHLFSCLVSEGEWRYVLPAFAALVERGIPLLPEDYADTAKRVRKDGTLEDRMRTFALLPKSDEIQATRTELLESILLDDPQGWLFNASTGVSSPVFGRFWESLRDVQLDTDTVVDYVLRRGIKSMILKLSELSQEDPASPIFTASQLGRLSAAVGATQDAQILKFERPKGPDKQ
jgi:hypothetical protein